MGLIEKNGRGYQIKSLEQGNVRDLSQNRLEAKMNSTEFESMEEQLHKTMQQCSNRRSIRD